LVRQSTDIQEDETAQEFKSRLAEIGADLISETLRNLADIEPKPQIDKETTFAPILKREDGLIDWSMDAYAIARSVRGFQPWPNGHTSLRSQRLIIWAATPEWIEQLRFPPGQGIEAGGDRLLV